MNRETCNGRRQTANVSIQQLTLLPIVYCLFLLTIDYWLLPFAVLRLKVKETNMKIYGNMPVTQATN